MVVTNRRGWWLCRVVRGEVWGSERLVGGRRGAEDVVVLVVVELHCAATSMTPPRLGWIGTVMGDH